MNENLDLVKVLKGCPSGTKLYSKCLGTVEFNKVIQNRYIEIVDNSGCFILYRCNGKLKQSSQNAEIDLFPSKDQYDWSKWQRPFVDGDVVMFGDDQFAIFKEYIKHSKCHTLIKYYAYYDAENDNLDTNDGQSYIRIQRLATEDEKQKLFDAIKSHGYKWNTETKTLEKLIVPKFKVGDKVVKKGCSIPVLISEINDGNYYSITENSIGSFKIKEQDNWELVPNKFDVTTLKPFDKVLVRDNDTSIWVNAFFGFYDSVITKKYPIVASGINWAQCIPYEGNEHLLGTFNQPSEFYRCWED